MEWLRNILSPTPCTNVTEFICLEWLWFAWKSVPLWYLKQHCSVPTVCRLGCDLLENSYLCGISNNHLCSVVYWKVLWFAWKFVPLWYQQQHSTRDIGSLSCCDLLENSYLCGISNNELTMLQLVFEVVICLKIRTFVVSATTKGCSCFILT